MVLFLPDLILWVRCGYCCLIWSRVHKNSRRANIAAIYKSLKLISSNTRNYLRPSKHEVVSSQLDRSGENIGITSDVLSGWKCVASGSSIKAWILLFNILIWVFIFILIQVIHLIIQIHICLSITTTCHGSKLALIPT